MKKIVSIGAALLALLIFATIFFGALMEEDNDYPTLNGYVSDYANIITDADERTLNTKIEELSQKTKAQMLVLTVESLKGKSLEDYAYHYANQMQIGDEELDNGILLLVSLDTEDRGVRIEVGKGLEGALPDGKVGRILDQYTLPYFYEAQYSKGIIETAKVVVNEIYIEFGQAPDADYKPLYEQAQPQEQADVSVGEIISIVLFVLLFVAFFAGGRRGRIRFMPMFFGGPHFPSGRGGSGGGFGGFTGGGGSFGGGGASRRF